MKFLLDMGLAPGTAAFLRGLGHEAIHLHDEGLDDLPDPQILERARVEGFILLTHDLDFPELVAASQAALPSLVVFRLRNMRPGNVESHLLKVLEQSRDALERGAVVSVTEGMIRIRFLPLGHE
ncbi:MAG TPA: DUF5615 family PIN-like protein [Rubrobacter sp.]|nr:DUF5615 family PIN-like protein [Rubrobacter sp.]